MNLTINRSGVAVATPGRMRLRFSKPEHARAFGKFCLQVKSRDKALSPADDADGGYAIPDPEVAAELFRMVDTVGVATRIGRNVPMGPGGFRKVRRTAGATVGWKTPGATGQGGTPGFGALDMRPETLFAYIDDTMEWDEDSLVDVGNYMAEEFVYALAAEEDRCAFVGTGSPDDGGIVGILNSDRVTVVQMATGTDTDAFTDLTFDHLVDLEAAVAASALDNADWLFHRTIKAVVKKLKDSGSNPIWQPAAGAEPSTILGYGHQVAAKMRASTESAAETTFMAFGDFYQGLYVGRRGELRIEYSDQAEFKKFTRVWRAHERISIAVNGYTAAEIAAHPELANPIAVLKTGATS